MDVVWFETLLKKAIGLDAGAIGRSAIERAIRERQRGCELENRLTYWERVRSSKSELQALVEAVVVPETWFFRDRDTFVALGFLVRHTILRSRPDGQVRVLSLPCSTGEEPYSIAMMLLDAGVPEKSIRIDAVDVSDKALSHGQRGEYGKSSFRGASLVARDRYFEAAGSEQRVQEDVRTCVTFQHGNLLEPSTLTEAAYDIIFCRNLLIYFDRATQDTAAGVLSRLLAPGGVLFVGAAETAVLANRGFTPSKFSNVTAFRKPAAEPGPAQGTATPVRRLPKVQAPSIRTFARPVASAVVRPAVDEPRIDRGHDERAASESNLEAGIQLANEGRFSEAAVWCEEYLRRHEPSPQVFHLLGLVRDAAGNHSDAAMYYRKALYLDPQHEDSLVHLALLMEAQNNRAEADLLRSRARRAARRDRA
jgi:chemotaxis protein methyltransferase WspC